MRSRFHCIKRVTIVLRGPQEGRIEVCRCTEEPKVAAMTYSCVEQISHFCTTKFFVKETDASAIHCEVDLNSTISWRGEQFQIVTGTCLYYLSTQMICPCACAAMQCIVDNVHPFFRIWYHPLWKEAIKSLQLSDYKDSPYHSLTHLEPTSNTAVQDPLSSITLDDTM